MANMLLTDGRLLTLSPSRDDRIRVLKHLARTQPVYGYTVIGDVFVHAFERHPVTYECVAKKEDAFIVHMGSRSMRRVFTQPYAVTGGTVRVDFPLRDLAGRDQMTEDPYADIFVSVPDPTGKPS
jgi:hypothetical protein